MIQARVLFTLSTVSLFACEGVISEPTSWDQAGDLLAQSAGAPAVDSSEPSPAAESGESSEAAAEPASEQQPSAARSSQRAPSERAPETKPDETKPESKTAEKKPAETKPTQPTETAQPVAAAATGLSLTARVGVGEIARPVAGPGPLEIAKLSGDPYTLVKNWDFGTEDTVRNKADLDEEFNYHDHFGTIANGVNYGSVTAASSAETAVGASDLGLPDNKQPVEDPKRPVREFTAKSMLAHVLPLSAEQETVSAAKHDAINGSLTAKWNLPTGGKLLGRDLVWETRVRMPKPVDGYWFAVWTAGKLWNKGAEMDVLESFGAPHILADAFHSDSVGGKNNIEYKSWPSTLDSLGIIEAKRELADWHTWTWVYLRDDTYDIYYDGFLVQHGDIHWTDGADIGNTTTDMHFLLDFSWGHTQVTDVNIELPASDFPVTYEIDYSRVYMR
ncbi:MAG: hypothetical protein ABW321_07955 [Polyangiales bacterium]